VRRFGGEVVVIFVTASAIVVADNAVERIMPTLVRSDNAMRTNGTRSNPSLNLLCDRVFVQLGSGGVVNGTLTTEGSITVRGVVRIVAEFLGKLVITSTNGYWAMKVGVHHGLADLLACRSLSTNSEFILVVGDVRSILHPVRGIPEGPLHLTLLSAIQLGLGRTLGWTFLPFGVLPLLCSVGFPFLLRLRNGLGLGLVVCLLMQGTTLGGALARCLVIWCPDLWDSAHYLRVQLLLLGALGGLFLRLPFLRGNNMMTQLTGA